MARGIRWPANPLSRLYSEYGLEPKHRQDLNSIIVAVVLGTIFGNITTGTPLTGLARDLGASDFFYALLMALPIAGGTMQFVASWLIERAGRRKRLFVIFGVIQRSLWLPVGLVPYVMPMAPAQLRLWTVILLVTLAAMSGAFVNVGFFSWLGCLVPLRMRGRYLALRASFALMAGVVASLGSSYLLDTLPGMSGYPVVFSIAAACGVMDILCYVKMTDPPMEKTEHQPFHLMLREALSRPVFMRYLLYWTVWAFFINLGGPFLGLYMLGPLKLSFTMVTLSGVVISSSIQALITPRWGALLDRYSAPWVLRRCLVAAGLIPLLWVFARPGLVWPVMLYNGLYALPVAGINLSSTQMLIAYTPEKNRSLFVAMYSVITSLFGGAGGYLAGGALLELMGSLEFDWMGLTFDRYKILFIASMLLMAVFSLLALKSLEKATSKHPDQGPADGTLAGKEPNI